MDTRRIAERLERLTDQLDEMASRIAALTESQERSTLLAMQNSIALELARLELVPLLSVTKKFDAWADDLARSLEKRVHLEWHGWDLLELDSSTRDRLQDALVPALRNALDHGIDTPGMRSQVGKPEVGQVEVMLTLEGARVILEVRDDGQGLDAQKMLETHEANFPGQVFDQYALNEMVFSERFSTREHATQTSGRGVGLSGLRSSVRELGGDAMLRDTPGKGLVLRVEIPVTRVIAEVCFIKTPQGDPVWVLFENKTHSEIESSAILFRPTDPAFAGRGSQALELSLTESEHRGVLSARALPRSIELAPLLSALEFKRRYVLGPK